MTYSNSEEAFFKRKYTVFSTLRKRNNRTILTVPMSTWNTVQTQHSCLDTRAALTLALFVTQTAWRHFRDTRGSPVRGKNLDNYQTTTRPKDSNNDDQKVSQNVIPHEILSATMFFLFAINYTSTVNTVLYSHVHSTIYTVVLQHVHVQYTFMWIKRHHIVTVMYM